jgi:alpha/beta superfamily hydrolase
MTTTLYSGILQSLATGLLALGVAGQGALAQGTPKVVDIPTRPGVTQRFIHIAPPNARAAVILMAGGHGGLQITSDGGITWGKGNFLVRTRQQFADAGLAVAVVDAPSDRQSPPFLNGLRQTPEHTADIAAVIAWLKQQAPAPMPVWLAGTSRGTQSAGYIATELSPAKGGPDGLILTATILTDSGGRAVPKMPLETLGIPVLVVHHELDACRLCRFSDMPPLMEKLARTPKAELITITGGQSIGDPCEAMAYHGFNGREADVVSKISSWVLAR